VSQQAATRAPAERSFAQVKKEPSRDVRVFHPDQPSVVPSCDFKRGIYDKEMWDVHTTSGGSTIDMVVRNSGKSARKLAYSVPIRRANKALRTLHPLHIHLSLEKPCGCKKACNTMFSYHDIADKRLWYLREAGELASRSALVNDLIPHYNTKTKKLHYYLKNNGVDVAVCSNFYMQAIGVHENKMSRVRAAVRAGNTIFLHGNEHKKYKTNAQKASRTRAFWRDYYPIICQVIQDRNIVLPQGTVMLDIYKMTFVPWWTRKKFRDQDGQLISPPCFRTFGTQGHHPDFGHVLHRSKHTHLRCDTCASLRAKTRNGFKDGEDVDKYMLAFGAHQVAIQKWQDTENYWKTLAANSPHKSIVILGDDTSSLAFPHLTNRDYKSLATKHRVKFVPWLYHNFANDAQTYIYSLKNKFKKVCALFRPCILTHTRSKLRVETGGAR
jgi:hypothetical protein